MNPNDQPEPTKAQPGAVFNPGTPTQTPPPALEPDPAPPDDPRPEPVQSAVSVSANPQQSTASSEPDTPLISWQASEYMHHDKKAGWYLIFFAVVAGLIAIAAITHQWLTIGLFVVMAGALMMYANKPPRVLNYSLGEQGIQIETKFYPYSSFRSFGVMPDMAWHLIDLEPLRRFMPRLSIMFEDAKRDDIVEILSEHMPRQDRQPDLIERAARYLRF